MTDKTLGPDAPADLLARNLGPVVLMGEPGEQEVRLSASIGAFMENARLAVLETFLLLATMSALQQRSVERDAPPPSLAFRTPVPFEVARQARMYVNVAFEFWKASEGEAWRSHHPRNLTVALFRQWADVLVLSGVMVRQPNAVRPWYRFTPKALISNEVTAQVVRNEQARSGGIVADSHFTQESRF